jgi:hypothetical protein
MNEACMEDLFHSRSGGLRLGGVHPTPNAVGSTSLCENDPTY